MPEKQQPWSKLRKRDVEQEEAKTEFPIDQVKSADNFSESKKEQTSMEKINPDELFKRLTFGGICGFTTGGAFGGLDGFKAAKNKSPMALVKEGGRFQYILGSAARTGFTFGAFYAAYQGTKHVTKQLRGKDDPLNAAVATVTSLAPMLYFPFFRGRFPYAVMLIAIDVVQTEVMEK
mmetsp:Transcript_38818/g.51154  ORF Transcript_38818/g.51154 Transcript_38818/m.51154 type:complete len:177 (+) Transcript_38818:228-758(+)|eukprot:CAMPEP_0117741234 /NCGR_PEP_ID=MMETSP0947-20121206/4791_1 /TAXON_ID=44440 /ORGANISM="Chattonella subsalsa, Strain CCMP2191" /LENGTH=176 /DNA_ID=CAMNT_0005557451 /DNA_START=142 /DNA_END=672 /DNA_ORIENTATION=-